MKAFAHLASLLLIPALDGCAVGMMRVDALERPVPQLDPALPRKVTFDVCVPRRSPPESRRGVDRERNSWGSRITAALAQHGQYASLTASPGADAQLHFTVTPTTGSDYGGLMTISFLSASVIPGYAVERTTFEVDVAYRNAAGQTWRDHLRYEYRTRYFVWLPLVVYPDFIMGLDGGWESSKTNAGLDRTIARLTADLDEHLRRGPPPGSHEGAGFGVACERVQVLEDRPAWTR